ncbi:MAG TPA: flagellar assembly protein FliW [Bacteroidota bacterium]|nr:flagellar assembly protein FliW [Bacteroidota bacterium]
MKFLSRQFGELECADEHRISFPNGIIGFEEYTEFIIVHDEDAEPFRWLVSTQTEDLCFPLISPALVTREYQPALPPMGDEPYELFVIVCLRPTLGETTANLKSPLVITSRTRTARQVVLTDDHYSVAHKLF